MKKLLLNRVATTMIDDSLLLQLKEIGMSEYEAKVYVALSAFRNRSAHTIRVGSRIVRIDRGLRVQTRAEDPWGLELSEWTPRGRFELPRCQAPVAFEATAFPD